MPKFKIGDKISNGKIQYTVLDIETNQNGVLCYIFKHPIKDNNFRWVAEQVDKMFELISNTPDSFDWESFRNQAAKDILCAMIQGGYAESRIEYQSKLSVMYADELVKQLKEKEEK